MSERYLLLVHELYALAILRPLQDAIRARGAEAAWFYIKPNRNFVREGERVLSTVAEVKRFDPIAVLVPGNTCPDFFPGLKVELFHGFDARKRPRAVNGELDPPDADHYSIRGFFDLYCTQGPATTKLFQHLAEVHGHFSVKETGWPKVDPLFLDSAAPYRDPHRPNVMIASTFSPRVSLAEPLLDTIRSASRNSRWKWIVTLHPKMARSTVEKYKRLEGPNLEFVETDDIIPLYRSADVMLCDTSSALSEFMLQRKPVVTFRHQSPADHLLDVRNPDEVLPAIEHAMDPTPELMGRIDRYIHDIHPYRDGRSSERVLAAIQERLADRSTYLAKPLNLIRRFRVRRELGYYRWN